MVFEFFFVFYLAFIPIRGRKDKFLLTTGKGFFREYYRFEYGQITAIFTLIRPHGVGVLARPL